MARERRASEHTAATGLTPLELSVFDELNSARSRPKELAQHLMGMRPHFDGLRIRRPGHTVDVMTKEGLPALEEAISFLEGVAPLPPFERVSAGMSRAARDHVDDSGRRGSIGHEGTDGSTPFERMSRHGEWRRSSGENINYSARDAKEVVVQLIVDDGVPGRGHRTNIFKPDFNVVGIAGGQHKTHDYMVVITFAGDFVEAGAPAPPVSRVALGGNGGTAALVDGVGGLRLSAPQPALEVTEADVPPGGRKEVRKEVSVAGKTKTTKVTTVITDAQGNTTSTRVETRVETAG